MNYSKFWLLVKFMNFTCPVVFHLLLKFTHLFPQTSDRFYVYGYWLYLWYSQRYLLDLAELLCSFLWLVMMRYETSWSNWISEQWSCCQFFWKLAAIANYVTLSVETVIECFLHIGNYQKQRISRSACLNPLNQHLHV